MASYYQGIMLKQIQNKALILTATLLKTPTRHFQVSIFHFHDNPKKVILDVYLYKIRFIELIFPHFTSPPELYKKLTNEVNTQRLLGTIPTL